MAVRDALFNLVKALSPSEKRYFRLQTDIYTSKKSRTYLELFDLLDKMKEYDKSKVEAHFKGRKLLNNLSAAKAYLMDAILASLFLYRKPSSSDDRIGQYFQQGDILMRKGVHEKAMQYFKRGNDLAEKTYNFKRYYEGLLLIRDLTMRARRGEYTAEYVDELHQEMQKALHFETEITQLKRLHYHCLNLTTKGPLTIDKKKATKELKVEMEKDFYTAAAKSDNPVARVYYHQVQNQYYILKGDYQRSYEALYKVRELYLDIPYWIEDNPSSYLAILSNLLSRSALVGDWEKFYILIEDLDAFEVKEERGKRTRFESLCMYRLIYAGTSGSYLSDKDLKMVTETFETMAPNLKPVFRMAIGLHLAIYYYTIGKMDKALHGLNQFLNDPATHSLVQLRLFARLAFLCLHYDLENYGLVESELESIRRKTAEKGFSFETEKLLVERLALCMRKPKPEHPRLFSEILEPLAHEREIERFHLFLDVEAWIRSKVKGISFQASIQECFNEELKKEAER